MDFLRASGRAAGLSLHPLQPADSSHVCTLRRPSPGWRTLPAPMPTGLTTCSRVLPEDRRILVLTSVSFRGAFSGRPTSSDASVRHSCLSRFVAVADPSFIAWLGLWPGESKEFQLLIVVWPLAGDADPSRRPLRSLRDIAESSQECGPFRVAHSRLDLAGVEGVTRERPEDERHLPAANTWSIDRFRAHRSRTASTTQDLRLLSARREIEKPRRIFPTRTYGPRDREGYVRQAVELECCDVVHLVSLCCGLAKLVAAIHSVNVAIYLVAIDDGQRCTVSFAAEAAVPG